MQNLFENNYKNNQEVLDVFNQAAQVGLAYSVNLWKSQSEYVAGKLNRNLAEAPQFADLTDPEKAISFHKELGEEALADLQENGEAVRRLTEEAGEEFVKLGKKGKAILAKRFDEAVEQAAATLPNGNGKLVAGMWQDANRAMWQLVDNGFEWAYQSTRAGVDNFVQRQEEVKDAVVKAAAANGVDKPAVAKKRK